MKVTISFKHLDHTPSLDEKIKDKTMRLKKYFDGSIEVFWTCETKDGVHIADVKVHGNNFDYFACAKSDSLYKTLDLVIKKVEAQVARKKSKWKNHISHKHKENLKSILAKAA